MTPKQHAVTLLAALAALGCSDVRDPLVAPLRARADVQAVDSFPYALGVHVAALPGLDNPRLLIRAMNDWGEIVGAFLPDTGPSQAFKWQATRGLTLLILPSGEEAAATGVNDFGQVSLTISPLSFDTTGQRPAIWNWFGDVQELRLLSTFHHPPPSTQPFCTSTGINNNGMVFGDCTVLGQASPLPTIWSRFGNPDALHPGGGTVAVHGQTSAFSESGFIAGVEPDTAVARGGFVFTPFRQLRTLEKLSIGGVPVAATVTDAINDSGQVAGTAFTENLIPGACDQYAVAWLSGDTITDLHVGGELNGITDEGIIIGNLQCHSSDHPVAFVWTAARGIRRLPGLEGGAALAKEQSAAVRINHRHQVLGSITLSTGVTRKVIWTLSAPMW
jgi:uncharacterized membrane protein